ncbi:MsnO8 family LLM class oxidoreductase [Amycolatopsis sp. NPDC049868]|uniref:MsnO8 family LLM class oxidoreductase n=1 Tax=Amycolatopsis sp. NPDC049868 TaxID=3363934 RepID=UPI00379C5811
MASESPVSLSVLDLSPVVSGQTGADALRNTVDLARRVEEYGYRRYWVAEHHMAPGIASAAPAVLIGHLLDATTRIRVGSGAVLLGYHAPVAVAEQFGILAHLHPGRVDLGLGRSGAALSRDLVERFAQSEDSPDETRVVNGLLIPGKPKIRSKEAFERLRIHNELLGAASTMEYRDQVDQILKLVSGEFRTEQGFPLRAPVAEGSDFEVWVLSSSAGPSSATAAEFGLPCGVNYHISPSSVLDAAAAYRKAFVPSKRLRRPHLLVSADVVVAEDDATAREIASPYARWVLGIRTGEGALPFPSPAEAGECYWTAEDRALVADRVDTQIVGGPEEVVRRLKILRDVTGADELLITTVTHDHADRVRSYELLAKAW